MTLFKPLCQLDHKGQDESVILCKGLAPLRRRSLKPASLAPAEQLKAHNPAHCSCPAVLQAAVASRAQAHCSPTRSEVWLPNPRTASSHTSEILQVVLSAKQTTRMNNTPILSRTAKSNQHSQPCSKCYQNIYNLSVLPKDLQPNLGSCFLLTFLSPKTWEFSVINLQFHTSSVLDLYFSFP